MTYIAIRDIPSIEFLIQRLNQGEEMILEQEGVPICKVTPITKPTQTLDARHRIGLLEGQGHIPENWKDIAREEIEEFFGGL